MFMNGKQNIHVFKHLYQFLVEMNDLICRTNQFARLLSVDTGHFVRELVLLQ